MTWLYFIGIGISLLGAIVYRGDILWLVWFIILFLFILYGFVKKELK